MPALCAEAQQEIGDPPAPRSPQSPPSNDQTLRAQICNQSDAIQALNHRTIGAKVRLLKKWGKCGRNDSNKGFSVPRNKHKNATESLPNSMQRKPLPTGLEGEGCFGWGCVRGVGLNPGLRFMIDTSGVGASQKISQNEYPNLMI
jgi:hypothetical protein